MKESVLKAYFENKCSSKELVQHINGSLMLTGLDVSQVKVIADVTKDFELEKEHLIKLCDAYLEGILKNEGLETITLALICSDFFVWDNNCASGQRMAEAIYAWDNELIGYDVNKKNMQLWKDYLKNEPLLLDEIELKWKFRSKGKFKELYLKIDEILWQDWDPLGINEFTNRSEYQAYTPVIFDLKRKGADTKELTAKLLDIEKNKMGVFRSIIEIEEVVERISLLAIPK